MTLSLLFLLLASASALPKDHQVITGANPDGDDPFNPRGIISDVNKRHTHIDAGKTTYRRQKRATTAFLRAWRRLLKTTKGDGSINTNTDMNGVPMQGNVFTKDGSIHDAIRDFYSLGPRNIEHRPYVLTGDVGNKAILLRFTSPPTITVMDKDTPKVAPRIIAYFDIL